MAVVVPVAVTLALTPLRPLAPAGDLTPVIVAAIVLAGSADRDLALAVAGGLVDRG